MAIEVVGQAEHAVRADIEHIRISLKVNSVTIEEAIRYANELLDGIRAIVGKVDGAVLAMGNAYFVDNTETSRTRLWPKSQRYVVVPVTVTSRVDSKLESELLQFSAKNYPPDRFAFAFSSSFDLSDTLRARELKAVTREAVQNGFSQAELIISAISLQPASTYFQTPGKQLKLVSIYSDNGVRPRIMKTASYSEDSSAYNLRREPADIPLSVSLRMSFDIV